MRRLRWYVARLRSMPPAEVPHRVVEAVRLRTYRPRRPVPLEPRDDVAGLLLGLPALATPRALELQQRVTADLGRGVVTLFGRSYAADAWTRDPVTGREWPSEPARRLDYRHTEGVDPKWSWELHRLVHLLPPVALRADGAVPHNALNSSKPHVMLRCLNGV